MVEPTDRRIYGLTGEIGRDGVLTPELQFRLNQIQEKGVAAGFNYLANRTDDLAERKSPLIAMATGIGKGRMIHLLLERQFRDNPESKVLIIAGTKNVLVTQTHEALEGYQQAQEIRFNGDGPNSIDFSANNDYIESEDTDDLNEDTDDIEDNETLHDNSLLYTTGKLGAVGASVEVATIQAVQSAMYRGRLDPKKWDLVIIDEVHNIGTAKRKATIDQFEKVIGFTATPHRNNGRMKSPEQYGFEVVESLPLPEAQELRLLPPLLGLQINTQDVIDVIPTKNNGQIDYRALEKLLKNSPDLRPYIANRIASMISADGKKYKTVVAVNFVWEAQELAELLTEKGIKVGVAINKPEAKMIHSDKIPAVDSVERYKLPETDEKSIQVLISPYVASEGFDAPATEVLVWASPTDSALRYTQYTGRLARRADGKRYGVIVDCLYQTSQYSWAYNLGMWMKGSVKQMENGLLYLGPEQDIAGLGELEELKRLRMEADSHELIDLQREKLLKIQEDDFNLTFQNLVDNFYGSGRILKAKANAIVNLLKTESPDLLARRISGSHVVLVVTDKDLFVRKMGEMGLRHRSTNYDYAQENEFVITRANLIDKFQGDGGKIHAMARKVIDELKITNPEVIITRLGLNKRFITSTTNEKMFTEAMQNHGMILKQADIPELGLDEIPLTEARLNQLFVGDFSKLKKAAEELAKELLLTQPELIVTRRSGGNFITAITDMSILVAAMEQRGILSMENKLPQVQSGDFVVTNRRHLSQAFIGDTTKLRALSREVTSFLKETRPDLFVVKQSGGKLVDVCLTPTDFYQEMHARGAKIRS